ncbi:hypothetical protein ACGFZL_30515 [Streptomyces sp. NPDC048182]|uniref:hypothetical protein n=1 Tax=Streptomyces sp. NPDC048182 TaxID=3365507 RepID=UPI00371200DA
MTAPDGTRTRIYLLQFGTAALTDALFEEFAAAAAPTHALAGAELEAFDDGFPVRAHVDDVDALPYEEPAPYGKEQNRHAYLGAGDVLALVAQDRAGGARDVPFRQTVVLQSQLLR